ncbi:hypothetical protein CcaverHIS002_0212520 [Cutaneotrichosporon cavernicola]|uniref:Uncharacterized protein n=1 Tax=Cutaneotrichosporon cavernicola TaxID=279322 RepID=A0AA48I8R0_9TREE|nr:uncharacterized protein CcaverHIS019_0212520 [Cutaneotrichosporon cavernicola]BEI82092.1 hypothetical protein CcaverHIS002_0212520 [Cutaneotrichosporon cavernicola]BEI89890.1 hypothetical protein CcaverHIS019_0212520 [Cutaneotrichosporon cavernicola]BEI97661.1 hypothetical protein CcaverHIS631_0212500 [Cutaneotrichosporon cavernicola]BEJ05438.1 hypothetical protein CcaverHIS641_0212550 [Cutaneotrichosporon cavernicola]
MSTYTPPPSNPPTRKHSLHYILSPTELARDAPDVPNVASPTSAHRALPDTHTPQHANGNSKDKGKNSNGAIKPKCTPRPALGGLPKEVLAAIAINLVVDDEGNGQRPSRMMALLYTCKAIYSKLKFDNNPVLYNRLFRATFDLGALIRRTQWMFDVKTDIPGTSKKTELFANPRSWATEYRDRWSLRNRMRDCVRYDKLNLDCIDTDLWALWFLWTENDKKNFKFLYEECLFYQWIMVNYKDDMLSDSLKTGYPRDTPVKALGIWLAMISGSDLYGERTPAEVDEKIFLLRPYAFACFKYEMMYADWKYRKLPLCKPGCTDHPVISSYTAQYNRFGHSHRRAPPHFVLGAYLCYMRILERQPGRIGMKAGSSTVFLDEAGTGVFTVNHLMPSVYHDPEWQRNTVCQDPHTSPGLPPLTFLGRLEGFWRGRLLFFDFDAYRQMLAGNMPAVYTGTFATHAAEAEIRETVIQVREEDVGGKGSLLNAGFADEEREEEQERIRTGYGHKVLTGDDLKKADPPGYTKEILLSGRVRSSWGWSRVRGRVRSWDGLVQISLGNSTPHPLGQWIWRGYIHTGGYLIGRWRDTYTPESQFGYEGPLGMVRAGDMYYPSHFPKSMAASTGTTKLDFGPDGGTQGPGPGQIHNRMPRSQIPKSPMSHTSASSGSRESSDDPMEGRKRRVADDALPPRKRRDSERPGSRASRDSNSRDMWEMRPNSRGSRRDSDSRSGSMSERPRAGSRSE